MNWNLHKSEYQLADECLKASPATQALAGEIASTLSSVVPEAWKQISRQRQRRDSYFFRLVVPLAELFGWPKTHSPSFAVELSSHFLWCFAWRAFDDAVDIPDRTCSDLAQLMVSHSDAVLLTSRCIPKLTASFTKGMASFQRMSCEATLQERKRGLKVDEAWKRCSHCFIVPTLLWRMSRSKIAIFKSFINVIGLTHDIHDLLSDVRLGINTPPVRWLAEIDSDFPFRPQMTKPWFQRAHKELSYTIRECGRNIKSEAPVIQLHLNEADEIARELQEQ